MSIGCVPVFPISGLTNPLKACPVLAASVRVFGSKGCFIVFGETDFRRGPSLLSTLLRIIDGTSEAISIMHKSWKPLRRNGSSLYRLVRDFISEDFLVSLVKVLVAIVHCRLRSVKLKCRV
jgi:hypothetical protein